MGRDHSETCETCGHQRGGLDNLECLCDVDLPYEHAAALQRQIFPCALCGGRVKPWLQPPGLRWHFNCEHELATSLSNLARCLRDAGALCAAWEVGRAYGYPDEIGWDWRPGCGREWKP